MSKMKSDITFDGEIFNPDRVPETTKQINNYLISQGLSAPKGHEWWEIGAAEFRLLQDEGKTSWPAPTLRLPEASYIEVPSRDPGRTIKCRVMPPPDSTPTGTFLYIHGGGHVLGHCDWNDALLSALAKTTNTTLISPEYRLAPEHPFPSGPNDTNDVSSYLATHSPVLFSGPMRFIAGDSAGATLSMQAVLHLLATHPSFELQGAAFIHGLFDWSFSPSAVNWSTPLVMRSENMRRFEEAYLGGRTLEERRDPRISPVYHPVFAYPGSRVASIEGMSAGRKRVRLPPALFLCGTLDPVVDDQVLMGFKWGVAGGEAVVRFVEGAPHAFLLFPAERFEPAATGMNVLMEFLKERV